MNKKLKSWFGGSDDKKVTSNGPQPTSFSNQPNVATGKDRKYHRVTKDNFAEDQGLEEENGSLWRKEGQGSYLFSQNNLRMMGDIINVDVEGKAADNLSAKLSIIKQNLARVENPKNAKPKTDRTPAAADAGGAAPAAAPETTAANETKDADKKFDSVPCRITERNPDGSYRVKGQSPVYVGRHEYRLIVTGLVRPEDVSSDLVASSKLIEGKFDLVASNKDGHL
jgi:flagellar L-ring protein precursor FlgH